MNDKFFLINTCPRYGEHILRTFKSEESLSSFLMAVDAPSRYKLVHGEEVKFSKRTTMEFTPYTKLETEDNYEQE